MRKRDYDRLLRRCAVAYNLNTGDYERIMDEAVALIPQGIADSEDDPWEEFCRDLDEAKKIPPTPRQIAKHQREEKKKEIEDATRNFLSAQRRLEKALRR